ncbi:hypothetical protein BDK51DRAFT_30377 [Blyttiomyces helicus]|uniref:Uncharacterized protein n=1 Tax=Blyttiomyces helicus TaxID=388810 RepID=A0A4P9VYC8_9FUNG|nr:hypothetical protein BDK51DRAFT_30377 [Blyttiomyces helicus]|eukprot:RKO83308.1 hypothetical protein BDK51DRAFT_30377 [Blyttiomyces helicus]
MAAFPPGIGSPQFTFCFTRAHPYQKTGGGRVMSSEAGKKMFECLRIFRLKSEEDNLRSRTVPFIAMRIHAASCLDINDGSDAREERPKKPQYWQISHWNSIADMDSTDQHELPNSSVWKITFKQSNCAPGKRIPYVYLSLHAQAPTLIKKEVAHGVFRGQAKRSFYLL